MFMALALAASRADCDMEIAASVALLPMPQLATTSESMARDDSTPSSFFILLLLDDDVRPAGRPIVHDGPGTERAATVEDGAGEGKPPAESAAAARCCDGVVTVPPGPEAAWSHRRNAFVCG